VTPNDTVADRRSPARHRERALLVFMRYPEYGKVKTRLAAEIGHQAALRIHTLLVRRTLGIVHDFKKSHPEVSIFLSVAPPEGAEEMARSFPGPWRAVAQEGAHLGERMGGAMRWAFERGAEEVVLVGSDIVDIDTADLEAAFARLGDGGGAVLGPARDGGFYLIGLTRFTKEPFQPEEWGTDGICLRSEALLRASGMRVRRVSVRRDIDRPLDLEHVSEEPLFGASISVIVPTLKDPVTLLSRLVPLREELWPDDELIVVHGTGVDSAKGDLVECEDPVRVIVAPRGRGIQLNCGARCARGKILLFLHDDTLLPAQFPYLVRRASLNSPMSLGCFRLQFARSTRALDLIAHWANVRTRLFRLPYGDQALFCRREVHDRVGGFRRRYLMEDVDFVRACRSVGNLTVLDEAVLTSPERYLKTGVIRASLKNHLTMLLYQLGIDEERLYAFYYGGALGRKGVELE
jgi:uncharacterized protein